MKKRFGLLLAALLLFLLTLCGTALAEDCGDGNHGEWYYETTKEPDCTNPGSRNKYCGKCNKFIGVEPISPIGHVKGTPTVAKEATCTEDGEKITKCTTCGVVVESVKIPALGHLPGDWVTTQKLTCTIDGRYERFCTRCGKSVEVKTETHPGHKMGGWEEYKKATCTAAGEERCYCGNTHLGCTYYESRPTSATGHDYAEVKRVLPTCTVDGYVDYACQNPGCTATKREILKAPGSHAWGDWVKTDPSCTQKGMQKRACNRCGEEETKEIPALGHNWGDWVTVVKATCTQKGQDKRTCSRCGEEEYRDIPALDHDWSDVIVVTKPGCETPGKVKWVCNRCGLEHVETVPADGHKPGPWVVVKPATPYQKGLRERYCEVCGKLLNREEISQLTYVDNTMCAMGPRLRDVNLSPNPNTDLWYMFTPIDVSKDCAQEYDLVASNLHVVGTMYVTVKDGYMTVDYKLNDRENVKVTLEFYTVLSSMHDLVEYEPEKLLSHRAPVGTPILLQEYFGDDTSLVIYFCSRIDYKFNEKTMHFLNYDSSSNQALIHYMKSLMD